MIQPSNASTKTNGSGQSAQHAPDHDVIPHSPGDSYPVICGIGTINKKAMSTLGYTVLKPVGVIGVDIDWQKTKAISVRTSYIYINLKGREQTGIVEPEDYEQLVQDIISDLYNYQDKKVSGLLPIALQGMKWRILVWVAPIAVIFSFSCDRPIATSMPMVSLPLKMKAGRCLISAS